MDAVIVAESVCIVSLTLYSAEYVAKSYSIDKEISTSMHKNELVGL